MTVIDAVTASTSLTNAEIAGIITATFTGLALVGGVVVKLVVARAPIDKLRVQQDHKREDKREDTVTRLLNEERGRNADLDRENHSLGATNAGLIAEVAHLEGEKRNLTERVETLECNVRDLQAEVRECHENRGNDMRDIALWVTGELARVGIKPSEAPRPRSITPRDTPIPSAVVDAKRDPST
jgi:hypothetical protein